MLTIILLSISLILSLSFCAAILSIWSVVRSPSTYSVLEPLFVNMDYNLIDFVILNLKELCFLLSSFCFSPSSLSYYDSLYMSNSFTTKCFILLFYSISCPSYNLQKLDKYGSIFPENAIFCSHVTTSLKSMKSCIVFRVMT